MPAGNKVDALKVKKSVAACESVFKLDRDAHLPEVLVTVACATEGREENKRAKNSVKAKVVASVAEESKACVSRVFGPLSSYPVPQPNKERLQKILAEFPAARKASKTEETTCFTANEWQTTFNKLTGFNVTIASQNQEADKPVPKAPRPSFIESILGKRTSRTASKAQPAADAQGNDEGDDNIVSKVETKDVLNDEIITFDGDKKKKRQKRDPNELPQSMVERYGSEIRLTKKEYRRLQYSQNQAS